MSIRLYIGNLPSTATNADLQSKFGKFGIVESASVVMDPVTGRSKRFGFVEMTNDAEGRIAINRLNMTQYDDATMSVSQARADQ